MAAPARVYVHDSSFARIGELTTVRDYSRGFAIGGSEQGRVTVSTDEPLAAELAPQRGNLIVIESTAYPLAWAGYVVNRQGERATGTLECRCKPLESLLRERVLPAGSAFSGSVSSAFRQVIALANGQGPTGISIGNIASGSTSITSDEPLSFSFQTVGDALDDLTAVSGWEWWVEYTTDAGSVDARIYFAPYRGSDRQAQVSLIEGGGVDVEQWTEDYENQAWAVTFVGGQQHAAQVIDDIPASRRTQLEAEAGVTPFGLIPDGLYQGEGPITAREAVTVLDSLKASGLTEAAGLSELRSASKLPPRRVRVTVKNEALWKSIRPGDKVEARFSTAFSEGWEGPVRIEAVQPEEDRGTLGLVLSMWRQRRAEG